MEELAWMRVLKDPQRHRQLIVELFVQGFHEQEGNALVLDMVEQGFFQGM
jgi:hypothetical protein